MEGAKNYVKFLNKFNVKTLSMEQEDSSQQKAGLSNQ